MCLLPMIILSAPHRRWLDHPTRFAFELSTFWSRSPDAATRYHHAVRLLPVALLPPVAISPSPPAWPLLLSSPPLLPRTLLADQSDHPAWLLGRRIFGLIRTTTYDLFWHIRH